MEEQDTQTHFFLWLSILNWPFALYLHDHHDGISMVCPCTLMQIKGEDVQVLQDWNILFTLVVLTLKKSKLLSAHRQQYLSSPELPWKYHAVWKMNVCIVDSFPSLHSLCRSNYVLTCKKQITTKSNSCSFFTPGGINPHVMNIYHRCSLFPWISVFLCFSLYCQKCMWSIKVDPLWQGPSNVSSDWYIPSG